MDYKTLFSQTPPTRLFFKAAIPGSIGMLASALYQVADGIFISQHFGGHRLCRVQPGYALGHHQLCPGGFDRPGQRRCPSPSSWAARMSRRPTTTLPAPALWWCWRGSCPGRCWPWAGGPSSSWMGAQGELAGPGHPVSAGHLRSLLAGDHHCLRRGQLPAHLREDPPQHVSEHLHVRGLHGLLELLFMGVLKIGIRGAALGSSLGMALTAIAAFVPFFFGKDAAAVLCGPGSTPRPCGRSSPAGCPAF